MSAILSGLGPRRSGPASVGSGDGEDLDPVGGGDEPGGGVRRGFPGDVDVWRAAARAVRGVAVAGVAVVEDPADGRDQVALAAGVFGQSVAAAPGGPAEVLGRSL